MQKKIFIFIGLIFLSSCAPDHEIRALYEEKPCPQDIVLNSNVSVKAVTCTESKPITDVSAITLEKTIDFLEKPTPLIDVTSRFLETSIMFQKPEIDCHLTTDIVPVKWEVAVFFAYNKSYLTRAAKNKLNDNIWVLKHKPDMNISVRGYTDSRGSHSYNRALAKRRARSVKKYLIQHGIGKKRIIIDPIGESLPLLKEVTKADMATNRRFEMLLINNHLTPIPCIYLSHELKEKVRIKKIIDRDVYCSL